MCHLDCGSKAEWSRIVLLQVVLNFVNNGEGLAVMLHIPLLGFSPFASGGG
jgi:hypothetical protein